MFSAEDNANLIPGTAMELSSDKDFFNKMIYSNLV